jgi:peptidoglycan LD-endopeptidase LytH
MNGARGFLAGLLVGAVGTFVATRVGGPRFTGPPTSLPASGTGPTAAPLVSPPASTLAPSFGTLAPGLPGTPPPLVPAPTEGGTPGGASPFAFPSPEQNPLGIESRPSSAPGDSTDALIDPRNFAPPAAVGPQPFPGMNDFDRLRTRALLVPVQGFDLKSLRDNFAERRGARVHEAIDLLAPRGTPVLAVDDGEIKKLFNSVPGGLTIYQFDPSGAFAYYYAHLDKYTPGLTEGQKVKKGDRLGDVGTSGNAPPTVPHLHFTIFKLGPDKRWWEGTPINPYPMWAAR